LSEYQHYEFLTVDRPLTEADRAELRAISSRAQITSTSFTNVYNYGDLRGDPLKLMERWFDLHLYFANWGTRRLMMRLPARLVDRQRLDDALSKVELAELKPSGENLILDIRYDEEDGYGGWYEGEDSDRLAAIAPLRDDVLGGDLRLFYLLWLLAVDMGDVGSDEPEPLSGIGPVTGALQAFAEFFRIDGDLVAAAAEHAGQELTPVSPSSDAVRGIIRELSEHEKTELLVRLADGDLHVATELRSRVRRSLAAEIPAVRPAVAPRTAGELVARADEIRRERERVEAEREAAAQRRRAEEAAKARRARLDAIVRRGGDAWGEVEAEIARRNPKGYDSAIDLLLGLRDVAEETGTAADFMRRLKAIREEHANKVRFTERLARLE
jgi:hypothetical protein